MQPSLDRDLSLLFRNQRIRIARRLGNWRPVPVLSQNTIVVLTHRTAQGTREHLDVEMPTDLARERL